MKKFLAIFLSFAITMSFASCSHSDKKNDDNLSNSSSSTVSYPDEKPDSLSSLPDINEQSSSSNSSSQAQSSSSGYSSSLISSSSSKPGSSSNIASSSSRPSSSSSRPSSSSSNASSSGSNTGGFNKNNYKALNHSEMKAVWVSYLDLPKYIKGCSANQFRANMASIFSKMVDMGLNTVIMQVRPYADALYESDYFPWSHIATGTQGKNPGYDPLQIMIEEAHKKNLSFHAWVNPYRVKPSGAYFSLSSDNQAQKWLNGSDKERQYVLTYNNGYYYNPAIPEVRKLIVNGVGEIVSKYNVDGIHYDDYFYPATTAALDEKTYNEYKADGGKLSLADFRREAVNILVRDTYSMVNSINSSVEFGISPQGNISNNFNNQYADVEKWCSNSGYIEYICPQIYYGFKNQAAPFIKTVEKWNSIVTRSDIKLYIGLAAYKIGTEDTYAGASGKTEWITDSDILSRMVQESRKVSKYKGIALFRFDNIFNYGSSVSSQMSKEIASLKKVLS